MYLGFFMMAVAPLVPLRNVLLDKVKDKKGISSQSETTDKSGVDESTVDESTVDENKSALSFPPPLSLLKMASIGVGTGLMSGFFGVGGGAITVPALSILLPEGIVCHL